MVGAAERRAILVVALVVATALAGCAGGDASTTNASASSTSEAAAPTVDASTGSIAGVVMDDESSPLAGVKTALVEANVETTTDAAGRFTFNDVEPGSYRLITERLGFESVARKVDVVAGEVANVTLILKPLAVSEEPYHAMIQRNALIHVDNWFVSQYQDHLVVYVNSTWNSVRCDRCWFVLHIEPNPEAVLSEVRWTPSGNPAVNPEVQLWYNKEWSDSSAGTYVCGVFSAKNPLIFPWPDACLSAAKKVDKIKLYILGSAYGVSLEHKVETYTTFGYNGDLPETYTALPPA